MVFIQLEIFPSKLIVSRLNASFECNIPILHSGRPKRRIPDVFFSFLSFVGAKLNPRRSKNIQLGILRWTNWRAILKNDITFLSLVHRVHNNSGISVFLWSHEHDSVSHFSILSLAGKCVDVEIRTHFGITNGAITHQQQYIAGSCSRIYLCVKRIRRRKSLALGSSLCMWMGIWNGWGSLKRLNSYIVGIIMLRLNWMTENA